MENRRRLTRRQYSQTQRSLGLNASQVLHCGDLQRVAFQYLNLAVAVPSVISLVFLTFLSSWLRYVHLNYHRPFLPVKVLGWLIFYKCISCLNMGGMEARYYCMNKVVQEV